MARVTPSTESFRQAMKKGDVAKWLDLVTDTESPGILKTQPSLWQEALRELSGSLLHLVIDKRHPEGRDIIVGIKKRFPPAIAAFDHPLTSIRKDYRVGVALLEILRYLADTTRLDPTLRAPLERYGLARIAFLTWLDLAGYPLDSNELAQACNSCMENLIMVGEPARAVMTQVVGEVGPRTAAKRLKSYYDKPEAAKNIFSLVCVIAPFLVDSDLEFVEQIFQDKTLTRVVQIVWTRLHDNPMRTQQGSQTLQLGLKFIMKALLRRERLKDNMSIVAVNGMIQTCDLFGLCVFGVHYQFMAHNSAKAYTGFELDDLYQFTLGIVQACRIRRDIVAPYVQPHLLLFLDHIRDLYGLEIVEAETYLVSTWLNIVKGVSGMPAAALRIQARNAELDQRKVNSGGLVGCSWYQCIFNMGEAEGAVTRVMFLDNNCQRAQYCSQYCQKRDWRDGGHKRICKRAH